MFFPSFTQKEQKYQIDPPKKIQKHKTHKNLTKPKNENQNQQEIDYLDKKMKKQTNQSEIKRPRNTPLSLFWVC